jgi:Xaa-Pro aminopeptidase
MPGSQSAVPFDEAHLDRLLAEASIDAVVATSPHNTGYLLGGYRFFLYRGLDGIGPSRYVPVVGLVRGRPEACFFVGAGNEAWGTDVAELWIPEIRHESWSSRDAGALAAAALSERGVSSGRIAVEAPYLPSDTADALRKGLPDAELVDAGELLEALRSVKRGPELAALRAGAEAVVGAMLATFAATRVGDTKAEIAERLRVEQTLRGLEFAYCLVSAGNDLNRAPSSQRLDCGDVLSLDSGASFDGYVADLTRMGVAGAPSSRAQILLTQIAAVQDAARAAVVPGRRGGDIFDAAQRQIARVPDGGAVSFLAHGTGLLSHEAPRLTDTGSPPYPAAHRELPLQPGMALSIETHVADPDVGFVKLEDTVLVTESGHEACGQHGRGWNRIGS